MPSALQTALLDGYQLAPGINQKKVRNVTIFLLMISGSNFDHLLVFIPNTSNRKQMHKTENNLKGKGR